MTCKETLLQVFIDWRYRQSCLYFRPCFVIVATPTFSLVQISPPSLCQVQYIETVCGLEGVWVSSPVGDHIQQSLTLNI
jgi:hypothetical protein